MSLFCFEFRMVVQAKTMDEALALAEQQVMKVEKGKARVLVVPFRGSMVKLMAKEERSMAFYKELQRGAPFAVHADRNDNRQAKREWNDQMPAPIEQTKKRRRLANG
jgi:hypothetical protein